MSPTWRQRVIALEPKAELFYVWNDPHPYRIYWPAPPGKRRPYRAFTSREAAWKDAYTVAQNNLWEGALDL